MPPREGFCANDVSACREDRQRWNLLYNRIRFDPSTDDVLDMVTDVGRHMDATSVGFCMVVKNRLMILKWPYHGPGCPEPFPFCHVDEEFPAMRAQRTGTPIFLTVHDVRTDHPQLWPCWRDAGVSSAAVLPLAVEAEPVGILTLTYRDREDWTPGDRSLLRALAPAVAQAVKRARQ